MKTIIALMALAFITTACSSPEVKRTRGAGPGADVGNRSGKVEMHAGSAPFWETPKLITSQSPPLESAQHARNTDTGEQRYVR